MSDLDWTSAKKHFDGVERQYLDLRGVQGVNVEIALAGVFAPLSERYNKGERTVELHDAMRSVE